MENKKQDGRKFDGDKTGGKPFKKPYKKPYEKNFKKPRVDRLMDEDESILEGRNPIIEALKSGRAIDKIYFAAGAMNSIGHVIAEARAKGITAQEIDKRKLDSMSITGSHQGIIAQVSAVEYKSIDDILALAKERNEQPLLILCDGVTDPHNLGAIIRTAEIAGAHGVVIPKRRSAGLNAACAKAAAGALEYLPVAKVSNLAQALQELKRKGVFAFAADMDGDKTLYDADFSIACAIVIGGEGEGISALVKKECDFVVSIPQKGKIPSLNASNAAAILLFEAVRKRM